jgi:hypothetical protein
MDNNNPYIRIHMKYSYDEEEIEEQKIYTDADIEVSLYEWTHDGKKRNRKIFVKNGEDTPIHSLRVGDMFKIKNASSGREWRVTHELQWDNAQKSCLIKAV